MVDFQICFVLVSVLIYGNQDISAKRVFADFFEPKKLVLARRIVDLEAQFKRVPALDKCFDILEFLAHCTRPVGVSELSKATGYHRSTVFNVLNTLADPHVLSKNPDKRFNFGLRLYTLGRSASDGSDLIRTIHPYSRQINRKTELSTCLGIRAGSKAVRPF